MKYLITLICLINITYAQTITYDTIQVNIGWNIIGAVEDGTIIEIISTSPPGIITSSFFGYNSGYFAEDTLTRGKGYWVKVSEPGLIFTQIQLPSVNDPCDTILTVYYAGKTYNTVAIGDQCWLRENLNVGTIIMGAQDMSNNSVLERYCYNNDSVNCLKYGGLYQWDEAMQYTTTPGTQGICPTEWHIPTLAEFQTLTTVVWDGNALKAVGQGSGDGAGTNTSGFSAFLAGYRYFFGNFNDSAYAAIFWSSTDDTANGNTLSLNNSDNGIGAGSSPKAFGFSVRCIKD